MTVYIDVLLIVNMYIDYFLIKISGKLLGIKARQYRYILSAFAGSFFSFTIFLPQINFFINVLIMFISAMLMVFIAFGKCDIKIILKRTLVMFISNFIFSGFMGFISSGMKFVIFNNSVIYADISILVLIAATAAVYLIISIFQYINNKRKLESADYSVYIRYNKKTVSLKALGDTGNSLTDAVTGKPVIICQSDFVPIDFNFKSKLKNIDEYSIPQLLSDKNKPVGFKVIPFSTINSNGLLPVFTPDEVIIKCNDNKQYENIDALVGISTMRDKEYSAIFNPKILI